MTDDLFTVTHAELPSSDGELGILAHHSPMIAALKPGTLRYQIPGQEVQIAAVSPGMVKVLVVTTSPSSSANLAACSASS